MGAEVKDKDVLAIQQFGRYLAKKYRLPVRSIIRMGLDDPSLSGVSREVLVRYARRDLRMEKRWMNRFRLNLSKQLDMSVQDIVRNGLDRLTMTDDARQVLVNRIRAAEKEKK